VIRMCISSRPCSIRDIEVQILSDGRGEPIHLSSGTAVCVESIAR
jgi:hypothetical protein